jgi:hypothetical protein
MIPLLSYFLNITCLVGVVIEEATVGSIELA